MKTAALHLWIFTGIFFCLPLPITAQVDTAWVRRYDRGSNLNDTPQGMVVSDSGNVYVTGYSYFNDNNDWLTIKYSANGDLIWNRIFGTVDWRRDDRAWSMVIDDSSNIYITGQCSDTANGFFKGNIHTIKYDPGGALKWEAVYVCEPRFPDGGWSVPVAMAIDASNNLLVTGSYQAIEPYGYVDFITLKYNSSGLQWVQRYDGEGYNRDDYAEALAVDKEGNIYVTGRSNGPIGYIYDWATIKYKPDGEQSWVKRVTGRAERDRPNAITCDDSCNIYVVGRAAGGLGGDSISIIKYDSAGLVKWSRGGFLGKSVVVDDSCNVYVAGVGDPTSFVTYKFTSSGEEKWVRTISSLPYWTYANTLTLGSDGYLYVTGVDSIGQLTEGGNIITVKYDLNGNEQWIHRYGPENSLIWPQKITVDVSGSVYACGYFQDENGRTDYFTIKYRQSPSTKEEDEINNSADADILRIAPNPFITTTNISFELKKNTKVEIGLYNMQGQLVRMLAKGERPAGRYSEFWNGKDDRNKDVSQGIYFIKLRTSEGLSEVRKIVLLK